jgi:sulfatase maturation enzyme AslB (radical SAM superfamily)
MNLLFIKNEIHLLVESYHVLVEVSLDGIKDA